MFQLYWAKQANPITSNPVPLKQTAHMQVRINQIN